MIKPPKIPRARELIQYVIDNCNISPFAKWVLRRALVLMWRDVPDKRATAHPVVITDEMRSEVIRLRAITDLTQFEIADVTGLHNQGRISEILDGQR